MDIRAAVFERVVSRGKTMLSLTSNKLSLEQVFLRLTGAADNDEARRMLGIEMEEDSAATLEKIETAEELKEEEE